MMDERRLSPPQPESDPLDPASDTGQKSEDARVAEELEKRRRRIAWRLGLGVVLVVVILVAIGAWGQAQRRAAAQQVLAQQRNTVPTVRTETVKTVDAPRRVDLPGTMQAFDSATLYARSTGYITKREVDIGSRVHAGDLLAIISAPDLDQQLLQARAQLGQAQAALTQARASLQQAQANFDLANVTNRRYSKLAAQGYAAQQDADNARLTLEARTADVANAQAAIGVAQANVNAQNANVSRLEQLTSFERVTAPFDGVITARQVDVGDLVTANATSGTPLFSIARSNVLRVQEYVPQGVVFGLKDGDPAQITVPEMPGQTFRGSITRNASALQPGTRTLLAEVDIDNSDGVLAPGLYCVVHLSVPRPQPVVVVPSNAVIFNKDGLSVAVYKDGVAQLHHIDLAEDDGATVVVQAGLDPGDQIILDPPVDLTNGMRVAAAGGGQKTAGGKQEAANAATDR